MSEKQEAKEIVVFWLRSTTECSECGKELWKGNFLRKEGEKGLCMECADLDHLAFLGRGDAALTRRTKKYSTLTAVVVQWSRSRKRYERQGILADPEAIDRAEEECLADEELRARRREREAERRSEEDEEYIRAFVEAIREQFPKCPPEVPERVARHACRKYSGRVGRSAAAKELQPEAVFLAVHAHVRHAYTPYDRLLMQYAHRQLARAGIRSQVLEILESWGHQPSPGP